MLKNHEQLLDELLARWEQAADLGGDPSPEELCPNGDPEFLDELAEGIDCLKRFKGGFELEATDRASDAAAFRADFYEGIDDIEEGGQGRVIRARDGRLDRDVAVKVAKGQWAWLPSVHRRLEQEARITGNLEHPGVIPVYGFGKDANGQPYYAMRYVKKERTLEHSIAHVHGMPAGPERAVAFQNLLRDFLTVCRTVDYAHSKDVIHRDIKPANVLVGDYGEVFVMDWGIAKPLESSEAPLVDVRRPYSEGGTLLGSRTAGLLGTPAYMSPEQAEDAATVGKASDVYSLGATLYHLLTGKPPYVGERPAGGAMAIVERLKTSGPARPRRINSTVPKALEAVCRKAMRREPGCRYPGAGDLASEIERWLADEPVTARPDPFVVRARRWMKRHRTLVTGIAAAVLVAAAALAVTSLLLADKNRELTAAHGETEVALKDAKEQRDKAENRAEELSKSLYRNQFLRAAAAWRERDVALCERILDGCEERHRSLEWEHLKTLASPPRKLLPEGLSDVRSMAGSPDGSRLVVAGPSKDGGLGTLVLDARTREPLMTVPRQFWRTAVSPDGGRLAGLTEKEPKDDRPQLLQVWDVGTGKLIGQIKPDREILGVGFFEGADKVVLASRKWTTDPADPRQGQFTVFEFTTWDAATGNLLTAVDGPRFVPSRLIKFDAGHRLTAPTGVAISPDGRLAWLEGSVEAPERGAVFHDTRTGKLGLKLDAHAGPVVAASFGPDGEKIVTASVDRTARVWDAGTGEQLAVLIGHLAEVIAAEISPDGTRVATVGADRTLRVWDRDGEQLLALPTRGNVYGLAYLNQGRTLATLGRDGEASIDMLEMFFSPHDRFAHGRGGESTAVSLWELSPRGVASFPVDANARITLKVVTAGGVAAGVYADGFVRVWDLGNRRRLFKVLAQPPQAPTEDMLLNPGGSRLAIDGGTMRLGGGSIYVPDIALTPDGSRLAVAGDDLVRVFEVPSGKELFRVEGAMRPVTFTADGKHVIAVRKERRFVEVLEQEQRIDQIRDDSTRNLVREMIPSGLYHNDFFGDNNLTIHLRDTEPALLETLRREGASTVLVLDAATGQVERTLGGFAAVVLVHPDEPWLLTDDDLWDWSTGEKLRSFAGEGGATRRPLCFSPDGRTLLTADGVEVHLWDVATWRRVAVLRGHTKRVTSAAFSPDGRRLATGGEDRAVRLWDVESEDLLWTFDEAGVPVLSVAFTDDGRLIAAGGASPPVEGSTGVTLIWDAAAPPVRVAGR